MGSANLELVRSILAGWERGEYRSADWADPEIEVVYSDSPDMGTWTGIAGMAEGFRRFLSAWREWRITADEYRELNGEHVLALVHYSAVGKTSGLEVTRIRAEGANLFQIRGGKVIRMVLYSNRERALADLRLSGETDTSPS